jgi:hypothetical protein
MAMATSDFDKILEQSIVGATKEDEKKREAATVRDRAPQDQLRPKDECLAASKSLAMHFKHKHLDQLLSGVQMQAKKHGYVFEIDSIENEGGDSATIGDMLVSGRQTSVAASIRPGIDTMTLQVSANGRDGVCYIQSRDMPSDCFPEDAALDWFRMHAQAAVEALIEQGGVARSDVMAPRTRDR